MLNYEKVRIMSKIELECKYWLYLEVAVFYLYIISAVIYLFIIQLRGIVGLTKRVVV